MNPCRWNPTVKKINTGIILWLAKPIALTPLGGRISVFIIIMSFTFTGFFMFEQARDHTSRVVALLMLAITVYKRSAHSSWLPIRFIRRKFDTCIKKGVYACGSRDLKACMHVLFSATKTSCFTGQMPGVWGWHRTQKGKSLWWRRDSVCRWHPDMI